jgi:hypothetical protein
MRIPLIGTPPVRTPGSGTVASAVGDTVSHGTSAAYARTDHKHAREAFVTPAIVLGTAAAAGAATTHIKSDATIVAFDATNPVASAVGDTTANGSATVAARRDHKHAREAFGTPVALGTANAQGSASTVAASNHVHTGKLVKIANQTIGNTQTTVAHGLSGTPTIVLITPTSGNTFWMSAASDGTNVYLTASASGTCDVYVAL